MTEPTQFLRLTWPGMMLIPVLLLTLGCETNKPWWREKPEVPVSAPSAIPPTFLYTDDEDLRSHLEDRFEVEYRNMTPKLIFDQMPINNLKYETLNLPPGPELLDLKSPNISRREILYKISQFWELTMTVEEENGVPSFINVVGRGNLMTNEANIPAE